MAEICCGALGKTEPSSDAGNSPSREARKRRMGIRRFRFVAGVEAMAPPVELRRKKRRFEFPTNNQESTSTSNSNWESDRMDMGSGWEPCPSYGTTSICGRRRSMEDSVSVRPDFVREGSQARGSLHFFAVFDGHGCSHVAASCRDEMHETVADEVGRLGRGPQAPEWKGIMKRSFSRMDVEAVRLCGGPRSANCRCELRTPDCDHVGSTAVVAVVSPDRIVVANCGDSRAVLCRKAGPLPLSSDHKPDRPDELTRIQAAGGRVIYWEGARVQGVLAMSRAIGDSYLKPFVISEPEVTVTERSEEDECLILASDGLWDVMSNEMACHIARMCLQGNAQEGSGDASSGSDGRRRSSDEACADAALLLTKMAMARHSSDNVSVVVVDLRRREYI